MCDRIAAHKPSFICIVGRVCRFRKIIIDEFMAIEFNGNTGGCSFSYVLIWRVQGFGLVKGSVYGLYFLGCRGFCAPVPLQKEADERVPVGGGEQFIQ